MHGLEHLDRVVAGLLGAAAVLLGGFIWMICAVLRWYGVRKRGGEKLGIEQWSLRLAPFVVPALALLLVWLLTGCAQLDQPGGYAASFVPLAIRIAKVAVFLVVCLALADHIKGAIDSRLRFGDWPRPRWPIFALLLSLSLLAACGDTINPVRYQPVDVLVVKPCFQGRTPPVEARTLIEVSCDAKGECSEARCTDARPEACATHAIADLYELQREARQYRNLFRECSK